MPPKKSKMKEVYDDSQIRYYFVKTPKLDKNKSSYVWESVEIKQSSIEGRGLGLFAKKALRVNTMIPYGGYIVTDICNLLKKISTSSYLVFCGDKDTPLWRDGNPKLIKNEPTGTWVGCAVNEASGNEEEFNARLFLWDGKTRQKVPKYPNTVASNQVFIQIKSKIAIGEEIFAFYHWNKTQQLSRGYQSKPKPEWDDYNEERIPKKKDRSLRLTHLKDKSDLRIKEHLEKGREMRKRRLQVKRNSISKCNNSK
jgi:hypothetical protein